MILVRNKHTGVVMYAATSDKSCFDGDRFVDGDTQVFGLSEEDHDTVVCESVPEYFIPGALTYSDGSWSVVNQDAVNQVLSMVQECRAAADLAAAKARRQAIVNAITVTTQAGRVFDGNEEAQRRMTSAITAMDDGDELPWVLHDNTVAVVTRTELREALRLAGSEMAAIWTAPYTQAQALRTELMGL